MDEYTLIKKSSLRFKGEKKKKKKHRNKESGEKQEDAIFVSKRLEDADDHGGWWKVEKFDHIQEDVAIEFLPGHYAKALNNGTIVLGHLHPPGDPPEEEEIFTVIRATSNQIALKSGFGRYLGIDNKNRVSGLSEAIAERELFLPVFEDGRLAICGSNDRFISFDDTGDPKHIVAASETVEDKEIVNIRVSSDPNKRKT